MFNGYNAAPLISYNEFDQEKERKGDNVSKWSYGHDSDVQPSQSHSSNRQAEFWSAKPNFSGIPNVANISSKCNCSGCYSSSENQSYQGDSTRHRPWLPRTFSVPSNESCKLPGYHHWEGVGLPNQASCFSESPVPTSQFLQESGEKHSYYRHYQNSRMPEVNQPGVITSVKNSDFAKKDVLLKQKEEICSNLMGQEMSLIGQNGTKQPVFSSPGYSLTRNVDKRIEGRNCSSNVIDPSEKYANLDSYRYPTNVASYPLDHHISRLPVVEPYIKAVPSNFNQNRVPSTGHRNMKEELPQSYINQYSDSRKIICSEGSQIMNGNRSRMDTVYQSGGVKEGTALENFHSGQMHSIASPMPMDLKNSRVHVEYPNFGRDPSKSCDTSELEAQKLMFENKRHSDYFSRNNFPDLIKRNNLPPGPDNKKDCAMIQSDQINMAEQHYSGLPRPNHVSNVPPKYLEMGNPRGSCRVFCPKDFNADAARKQEKFDHLQDSACFQRNQEVIKNGNVNVHARLPQSPLILNDPRDPRFIDRPQNSFPYQSSPTPYRNYVRSEYSHQGYNAQGRYENPNMSQGVIGFQRNDLNQYNHRNLQQPMPTFSAADQFMPHGNNSFACDPHYQQSGTPEKSLLQQIYDGKNPTTPGVVHIDPPASQHLSSDSRADRLVEIRKPTYLDTVRSEEISKNGTSKISPLRLLRKKKFINQRNETFPVTTSVENSSSDATPALDVRKFWSTWAEEEEENVAPTQVVVLDCQNIDPEQAKLLNLYDSDPVRAVQLENGNIVTLKGPECEKESTDQGVHVNANVQVKVGSEHLKLAEEEKNNHQTINKDFYENQIGVIQQEEPIATRKATEDNLQVASSDNVTESSGNSEVLNGQSSAERPLITESATQKTFNEIPLAKNDSKPCKRVRSYCSQDNKEAVCHKKINLEAKTEDANRLDKWTEKKLDFLKRAEESKAAQILRHEEEKKKIFERRLSLQQSTTRCDLKKTSPNAKNESLRLSSNCLSDQDCKRDSEHEKVVERLSSFDDDSQSNSPNDVRADVSDLPTCEFRRNKFLDYTGREMVISSGTSVRVKSEDSENSRERKTSEVIEAEDKEFENDILKKNHNIQVLEIEDIKKEKNIKQDSSAKISWTDKNPAEKLGKNKLQSTSETPAINPLRIKEETGFRSPEMDGILKKSDMNFRSSEIKSEGELADGLKNQVKLEKKKMMAQRNKAKKAKKLEYQNQGSDQNTTNELTVENISTSKPTIKFSIQKSHDLKISFKVLNNNNKKYDKVGFDEETGRKEVEDKRNSMEEPKNSTELITLKLKRIQRDGSSCDRTRSLSKKIPFPRNGDLMKKSRRRFRRKKLRGLSPMKTPILKIKKSSYMQEKEKDPLAKDLDCDKCLNLSKKLHSDDYSVSDDFQVKETVDSAKIKLTFKRQKSDCETEYKINDFEVHSEDESKPEEVITDSLEDTDKAYWKKLKRTKNRDIFAEACFEPFKSEQYEETAEVDFYTDPESKEDPLKSEEKCLNSVSSQPFYEEDDDELKPTPVIASENFFSPQDRVPESPIRSNENEGEKHTSESVNLDDWKASSVHVGGAVEGEFEKNLLRDGLAREIIDRESNASDNFNEATSHESNGYQGKEDAIAKDVTNCDEDNQPISDYDESTLDHYSETPARGANLKDLVQGEDSENNLTSQQIIEKWSADVGDVEENDVEISSNRNSEEKEVDSPNSKNVEDFWEVKEVEKSGSEAENVDRSTNETNHSKNINSSYEYKSDEGKNTEKTYSVSLLNKDFSENAKNSKNEEVFENPEKTDHDWKGGGGSEDQNLYDLVDASDIRDDCTSQNNSDVTLSSSSETVTEDVGCEISKNQNLTSSDEVRVNVGEILENKEKKKEPDDVQNEWNLEEKITDVLEDCMEVDNDLLDDVIHETENPNQRMNEDFQSCEEPNNVNGFYTEDQNGLEETESDYHSDDINNNRDKSKEEEDEIAEDSTITVENDSSFKEAETNLESRIFQGIDNNTIETSLEDEMNTTLGDDPSNEIVESCTSSKNENEFSFESQMDVKGETFEEDNVQDCEELSVLKEQNIEREEAFSNSNKIEETDAGANETVEITNKNIHTDELLENFEENEEPANIKAGEDERIKNSLNRFLDEVQFDKSKRIHRRHSVKMDNSRIKFDKSDESRSFKFSTNVSQISEISRHFRRHSKAKSCPPEIKFSDNIHSIHDTIIDVPLEDIPLPPGEPPPENCFDLEKYLKELRNRPENESTNLKIDSKITDQSKSVLKVEEKSKLSIIESSFENPGINGNQRAIPRNEVISLCVLNTESCHSPFMSSDLQSCRNPSPPRKREDNRELSASKSSSSFKASKGKVETMKDSLSKEQATDLEHSKGANESNLPEETGASASLQLNPTSAGSAWEDHDSATVHEELFECKKQANDEDGKNFEKKSKTIRTLTTSPVSKETEVEGVTKERKSESRKRSVEKLKRHVVEKGESDDPEDLNNFKSNSSFKNETPQESDVDVDGELRDLDSENVDVDAMTEVGFENGFSRDGFYECEDIPTSEDLPIGEDIEVEKVSDDDKFRNIMQNCLDNAKKFLNVGNLKLFSCSVDDLLELDCQLTDSSLRENEPDKSAVDSTNHISRDVLLTSCEDIVGDDLELSEKFQPAELSMDFVPSFCSDASNNLCPEILPVDNWPYLEEEVPLSPTKPKLDEADLIPTVENSKPFELESSEKSQKKASYFSNISVSVKNSLVDNTRRLGHHTTRRVSLPVSESVSFKRFRRRSLMVDGEALRICSRINRQRRMTIESFTGNTTSDGADLKNEIKSTKSNNKLNKIENLWPNNKSFKCRLSLEKIKNHKYYENECKTKVDVREDECETESSGNEKKDLSSDVISNKKDSSSRHRPSGGVSSKSSLDYKSPTFQPKVMLFRISKNRVKKAYQNCHSKSELKSNRSHYEKRGSDDSSKREVPPKNKTENDERSDAGSKHVYKKHKSGTSNAIQNKDSKNVDEKPVSHAKSEPKNIICDVDRGKTEEGKIGGKSSKAILEILSCDGAKEEKFEVLEKEKSRPVHSKTSDKEIDSGKERKRKKSRFRNLHTSENQSEPEIVTKDVSSSSTKDFSLVEAEKVLSEIFKDCDLEKDQDLSSKTKNKKELVSVKSKNVDDKVEKSNGDKCSPVKKTETSSSLSKNSEDHVKVKSKSGHSHRSESSLVGEKNRTSRSGKDGEKTHVHRSSSSKEESSKNRKTDSFHSHKHEEKKITVENRRRHEHEERSKEKTRSDERDHRKHREKDGSRSKSREVGCDRERNPPRKRSPSKEKHSKSDHSQRKNDDSSSSTTSNAEGKKLKSRETSPESAWVCEVCGFNDPSERIAHIKNHPFHCQSCHLAFKTEAYFIDHLTGKHKDIRNQHHCLLCELSFDTESQYQRHLETREHTHLESVEKNTINTLFTLLTGQPCPVLGLVEMKPEWLPNQAGTVHFYHQATPLSLALQYLKMHHDLSSYSSVSTAHP